MTERNDLLGWLERWYQNHCDDEWEQAHGVSIQTLDNPGWLVKADVPETMADRLLVVAGDPPTTKNGNVGGEIWMTCEVKSGRFIGAGDPTQLTTILTQFRKLTEEEGS